MRTPREIVELFACRGGMRYEGENVSQLQHAWQCARLARQARASSALQLAAWLHDFGHLLAGMPGSLTLVGVDDGHERLSAAALQPLFGDDVTAPIALHVEAKRYLVKVRPGYLQRLSPDSIRSLALQGGPMSNEEAERFLARSFSREAISLRAWDDTAKAGDWLPPSEGAALSELANLIAGASWEEA